jgi:hypothetical protein
MGNWNDWLFLLIHASDHPAAAVVTAADFVAADVIFMVAVLFVALWVWGKPEPREGLLASLCATALALAANQALSGAVLWAALFGFGAYVLGDTIHHISRSLGIAAIAIAVLAIVAALIVMRRHEEALEAEAERALPGPLRRP